MISLINHDSSEVAVRSLQFTQIYDHSCSSVFLKYYIWRSLTNRCANHGFSMCLMNLSDFSSQDGYSWSWVRKNRLSFFFGSDRQSTTDWYPIASSNLRRSAHPHGCTGLPGGPGEPGGPGLASQIRVEKFPSLKHFSHSPNIFSAMSRSLFCSRPIFVKRPFKKS